MRISKTVKPNLFREFISGLSKNTLYTFNHFGKINPNSIDLIVKKELERSDKFRFFTFVDNDLIAYSFLTKFEKPTKKHSCTLGIVIADEWQNKGYGKKICQHMIKFAWTNGLKKIWLNVHADNTKAFNVYKSLGFEIEGIFMEDEVNDGYVRNIVSMALFKKRIFSPKERNKIWKMLEVK